jgi:hypothetical protein
MDFQDMEEAFKVINQMVADGVIQRYAIGEAVAAMQFIEAMATEDVDVFIAFDPLPGSLIVSPEPIYRYLAEKGYPSEREYVRIAGTLVQFLPASLPPLLTEALEEAFEIDFQGVPIWLMTAEHLMAIALNTGRGKDFARLVQFVEAGVADSTNFNAILKRHDLIDKWRRFEQKYLQGL